MPKPVGPESSRATPDATPDDWIRYSANSTLDELIGDQLEVGHRRHIAIRFPAAEIEKEQGFDLMEGGALAVI
jgi:hypothetical protein